MNKFTNFIFNDLKRIILNIIVFASYFIFDYLLLYLMIYYLRIDYNNLAFSKKVLTYFIFGIIYILSLYAFYRKELKKDFKDFKTNGREYVSKYMYIYILGVIIMGLSNVILYKITNVTISGNEQGIRDLISKIPLYMVFSTLIYAPFVEELIFRKSIKNIFKNKYLFIIISGLIFGSLHISNFKDFNQILLGIPYIIMGVDFAYIYYKSNNVFTTMLFHCFHNFILLMIQLLQFL